MPSAGDLIGSQDSTCGRRRIMITWLNKTSVHFSRSSSASTSTSLCIIKTFTQRFDNPARAPHFRGFYSHRRNCWSHLLNCSYYMWATTSELFFRFLDSRHSLLSPKRSPRDLVILLEHPISEFLFTPKELLESSAQSFLLHVSYLLHQNSS